MKIDNLYKFFDYIGLVTFSYLILDSMLYIVDGITDFRVIIRLLIGVGGLIVDGYLVFIYKK
ncbi:MAG: hypothetical protein WC906_04385 [Parcubacteria group bacterium]|jgi:hypothetical protein